jgi:hypothetical protein
MAEDEDLQLLRVTRPRQQPHQGEQVPHDEIDQRPEQCRPPSTTTKSREPSEPDARTAAERVCEPYAAKGSADRLGRPIGLTQSLGPEEEKRESCSLSERPFR